MLEGVPWDPGSVERFAALLLSDEHVLLPTAIETSPRHVERHVDIHCGSLRLNAGHWEVLPEPIRPQCMPRTKRSVQNI